MQATPTTPDDDGFGLIETMIAIGIVAVGLLGLAGVFTQGITVLSSSQGDFIAKEKAAEAIESVYAARDSRVLAWDEVYNVIGSTGTDGGIFLDGPRQLHVTGPDGLVNTADDGPLEVLSTPGPDGLLGTADDELMPLDAYAREIEIRDEGLNLKRVRVIVTYPAGQVTREFVVTTLISAFS